MYIAKQISPQMNQILLFLPFLRSLTSKFAKNKPQIERQKMCILLKKSDCFFFQKGSFPSLEWLSGHVDANRRVWRVPTTLEVHLNQGARHPQPSLGLEKGRFHDKRGILKWLSLVLQKFPISSPKQRHKAKCI